MASKVFFGYPSQPESSREALAEAAASLNSHGDINVRTWEDLTIAGRLVIDEILDAIAECDVAVFDATVLNENVLFEIGYAIGAEKPLWLVRDSTDEAAGERWSEVGIVSDLGYAPFQNSDEIVGPFLDKRPDLEAVPALENTAALADHRDAVASIFYMAGVHDSNAERDLSRRMEYERRAGINVMVADAKESSVEPLRWYVRQCATADVVLIHISAPRRRMATIHNARCGFVAGVARGLGRPVLMLAEAEYKTPFDYRDLLYRYENARDSHDRTNNWLHARLKKPHEEIEKRARYAQDKRKSSELASLRLGEPVAENEAGQLNRYFLETDLYREVLRGGPRLLVGRKGTGKTATLIRATAELEQDRRVLVCSLQPSNYDLTGFERAMDELGADSRHFLLEALWKYLLYSQMALDAATEFRRRPAGIVPNSPEWRLDQFLRGPGDILSSDFGVRIERALESLAGSELGPSISEDRARIANALHSDTIKRLRELLAPCLVGKDRVAILIDNLDASWEPKQDLRPAADLILALIAVAPKISNELMRVSRKLDAAVEVSVAVFLRSDIYEKVRERAPEPDKLPAQRITWDDEDALLRVIGERYVAGTGDENARPQEFWERYFTGDIDGRGPSAYIAQRVVPRPRDIVHWCSAALDVASRRGHAQVTPEDIEESERIYSQFAADALRVELGSLVDNPSELVFAFAGFDPILDSEVVSDVLRSAGVEADDEAVVLRDLIGLSFLGLAHADGRTEFAADLHLVSRLEALAKREAQDASGAISYVIHPAFRRYLDIGTPMAVSPASSQ